MVTREQAAAIALADAIAHGVGIGVESVVKLEEVAGRRPRIHGLDIDDHWIVYLATSRAPNLHSSTIIVVDGGDGGVLYRGSARDEG